MLESTLPEQIKPVKFARRGTHMQGSWGLAKFERLSADTVEQPDARVSIDASFSFLEGVAVLEGKITTKILLECQRCLDPVSIPLEVDINVAFVSTEERLANLPEPFEGVLLEEEEISIIDVVEQELLLALPIVAYHEECDAFEYRSEDEKAEVSVKESREDNPFGVLAQLKGKLKPEDSEADD